MRVRRALAALALAAAAVALAAAAVTANPPWKPRRAIVKSHGLSGRTERGEWCNDRKTDDHGGHVTGCAIPALPLHPKAFLPVSGGGVVFADVRRSAELGVVARLIHSDGDRFRYVGDYFAATPVDADRRRWRIKLPADLGDANALKIVAQFNERVWSEFWSGLRQAPGWPGAAGPRESRNPKRQAPKLARVTVHHLTESAVRGSYCATRSERASGDGQATGSGLCADYAYPLHPHSFLPITRGAHLKVNVRRAAGKVGVWLVRVDGDRFEFVGRAIDGEPVDSRRRVWRFRLPHDLAGATALDVFADFRAGGDADFWAGVLPVERWP